MCWISSCVLNNSGVFICRIVRNPELEAMRNTAKEEALEELPNLEQRIAELQAKTTRVHAGFLFDLLGSETLMTICLCLSSTKTSYSSFGWEEFGIHLGLNPLLIKVKRAVIVLCVYAFFNSLGIIFF
jgi:hypothetical protein